MKHKELERTQSPQKLSNVSLILCLLSCLTKQIWYFRIMLVLKKFGKSRLNNVDCALFSVGKIPIKFLYCREIFCQA